jgi:DNA-binding response OmpR family regulator
MHADSHTAIAFGDLVIDLVGHEVRHHERRIPLTYQEFELLRVLVQHSGQAFTRDDLIARIWADRPLDSPRTVDIHIYRLRRKLGTPLSALIETVRKIGYRCARPRFDAARAVGVDALGGRPAA